MYTGIEISTFRTRLNTGRTGHVPAILANFGQYQPVSGVPVNIENFFFNFLFI